MNSNPRFLVVDDEVQIQRIGARVLARGGYDCRVASSASEAMAILATGEIDVMLTDVIMPGINGLQLARLTRSQFPDVVVVMVSGRTDSDALHEARDAGAEDYVAKPFRPQDLIAAAGRAIHLGGRRQRGGDSRVPDASPNGGAELEALFSQLH